MDDLPTPPPHVDRRSWLRASLGLLGMAYASAWAADRAPQGRAQRFLAAVGAQRFEDAAGAFFFTLPSEPEKVAALAHHLQALQHDIGGLHEARPTPRRPTGAPKRFLQTEDVSAKAKVRSTVLAYELDSDGKGPVQLVLTMVGAGEHWRVRSLGAYWAGDR